MERIKQLRRWVCWNATPVKGRMTKVPCAANGGATGTDEKYAYTWVTYEEAVEAMKRNGYIWARSMAKTGSTVRM